MQNQAVLLMISKMYKHCDEKYNCATIVTATFV